MSRVTSSGAVIPELDGIRMLALICVIAHHVMAAYLTQTERFGTISLPRDWYLVASKDWAINLGLRASFGVRIFFALSGLIVCLPFARRYLAGVTPAPVRSFYLRRLVRIAPPYVISCLLYFLFIVLPFGNGHFTSYFGAFFPHLAASVAYLHGTIFGQASWINGVAWTLEVEVQFYLLAPLLALIFRIRPAATRRLVLMALMFFFSILAQRFIEPSSHHRLQLSVLNFLQYFLAGYLAADLMHDGAQFRKASSLLADFLFLVSAAAILVITMRLPRLVWGLPFCLPLLYVGALSGRIIAPMLRSPLMAIPGGMCYSIFLYHPLVIGWLEPFVARLNVRAWPVWADFAVQFAALFPPILLFSAVLYAVAERPFMILSHKLVPREQSNAGRQSMAELRISAS